MFKGAILRKLKKSKFEESEKISQKAIEILKNYQQKLHYSQGYLFLGEIYIDLDQREKALEYLKMSKDNFQDMQIDYWLDKTQEVLDKL